MALRGREIIADRIETALVLRGTSPIGLDALYDFFNRHHSLEPQHVNSGIREMDRRARILGELYPFKIHGEFALQTQENAARSTYVALTLLAPGGAVRDLIDSTPDIDMAVGFENIVVESVKLLWGPEGKAIRFGWPSEVGRPPEFDLAIRWLADQMGVDVGAGYRQPRRKDGGVDVVSWRPFADGRGGFPVALVQCTLQDNLTAKGLDIDTRLWGTWLALDVDPYCILATPVSLPVGPVWSELALRYLVLDRIRIAGLAPAMVWDDLMLDWMERALAALRIYMEEFSEL